jgi:flavin reductase (DIM6/NTAB) family NADH-FMN oxidoreductase RutF
MAIRRSRSQTVPPLRPGMAIRFRRAASFVPAGIAVLSGADVTMTVSSLHCVSFDPCLVRVALAQDSQKGAAIVKGGWFRARLLRIGEEGLSRGEGHPTNLGLVELECTIAGTHRAGDHSLVLAEVRDVTISEGYPIVYWRRGLHEFRPNYRFMASRGAFEEFVAAWEAGTLPRAQWSHAAHVAIGAYYAVRYPATAFQRTKDGILRYNEAVGIANTETSGYHETLTRFWASVLAKLVERIADPWEAACTAVERLGEERDLHYLYYGFDVVRDTQARRIWVAPDLEGS